jgi:hypothetical protein
VRRLALLALLLAFVAPVPAAVRAQPQPEPYAGIREMLDRRAAAVLAGDEEAFMATVAEIDPRFVERQRQMIRGFRNLGVSEYRLQISDRFWPELTTPREVAKYGPRARPTVLHVEERYRIEGYDPQLALDDLYLTFVRTDEGWKVASDVDLEDVGLWSGRKLWEYDPVITESSEHFRYVSHPDQAGAAEEILAAAERALEAVEDRWPLPWRMRALILAPTSTEELGRIIQATFDLDSFVAFAYSSVERRDDFDLVGHRIILNWPTFSQYDLSVQERILAHELLHFATREYTGPMVPGFVDEGVAEWVAGDIETSEISRRLAAGTWDRELPRDYQFITGDGNDITLQYQESFTSAEYAVDRFGIREVANFYRMLGETRLAPGTPRYHVDQAMRANFGLGYPEFEARWADWVEGSL